MTYEQFNTALAHIPDLDCDALLDALQVAVKTIADADAEAKTACDAYFADVHEKERAMKNRIAELAKSRDEIQTKIDALKTSLVAATVRTDPDKLRVVKEIKSRMRDFDEDRQTVIEEVELLEGAFIAGDPDLYSDAVEKYNVFMDIRDEHRSAISLLSAFVKKQEDICKAIKERIRADEQSNNYDPNRNPKIKGLYEHYYAEEFAALPQFDFLMSDEEIAREATKSPRTLWGLPRGEG